MNITVETQADVSCIYRPVSVKAVEARVEIVGSCQIDEQSSYMLGLLEEHASKKVRVSEDPASIDHPHRHIAEFRFKMRTMGIGSIKATNNGLVSIAGPVPILVLIVRSACFLVRVLRYPGRLGSIALAFMALARHGIIAFVAGVT